MTIQRRLRDHHRLHLERTRDALFEARVILSQLERDNSLHRSVRRLLIDEVNRLEPNQLEPNQLEPSQLEPNQLEQALLLRNRIRDYYL